MLGSPRKERGKFPAKATGTQKARPTKRGKARGYKVKGARLRKRPLQVRCARGGTGASARESERQPEGRPSIGGQALRKGRRKAGPCLQQASRARRILAGSG